MAMASRCVQWRVIESDERFFAVADMGNPSALLRSAPQSSRRLAMREFRRGVLVTEETLREAGFVVTTLFTGVGRATVAGSLPDRPAADNDQHEAAQAAAV